MLNVLPRLHLLRASYALFVNDFRYDFSGIVGCTSYDLCVYIVYNHRAISYGDKQGQIFKTLSHQTVSHCIGTEI